MASLLLFFLWQLLATALAEAGSVNASEAAQIAGDHFERPGAGGPPDKVKFGLWLKSFLGASAKDASFSADVVLTLRWTDPRAARLVHPGASTVSMGSAEAARQIWTPRVTISNRDIGGLEVISSATTIGQGGEVEKTDRLLARVKYDFDTRAFPFDSHDLSIHVASSALMADSVVLSPIAQLPTWVQDDDDEEPQLSGADPSSFEGSDFLLVTTRSGAFREVDGSLAKSRGELVLTARRNTEAYSESIFFPAFLLLGMSWTIFFFPLLPAFAMPRVATSCLAFLSLVTLSRRIDNAMPTRSALGWVDMFLECSEALLFGAIALNVTEIYIYHALNGQKLASRLGHELMLLYPLLAVVTMGICFSATDGQRLESARLLTRLCVGGGIGSYILAAGVRHARESRPEFGGDLRPALQPPCSGSLRSSGNLESLDKATTLCANLATPKTWDAVTFIPAGVQRSGPR